MSNTNSGGPEWNEERARWLVGKHVVVGVTYMASDGKTVVNKEQFHGMILSAVEGAGFEVVCLSGRNEGETVMLPPVTTPFLDARPGNYKLHSTGEIVTNPDVTVAWTLTQQPKPS